MISKRRSFAALLVGIAVALLTCWLVRSRSPVSERVDAVAERGPHRSNLDTLQGNPSAESARSAASAEHRATFEPTDDSLARRSIRVIGRCVDRDHRPVADARVELTEIAWWPKGQVQPKWIHGGTIDPTHPLPSARSAVDGTFSIPFELARADGL